MNRIARRSATEAADALLEAGRTEPVLDYDVELGLARHHDWLRSEAPLPEWASAGVGSAAKSSLAVLIKTIVSAVLVGALALVGWQARGLLQPRAAESTASVPAKHSVEQVPAFEHERARELTTAPRPLPVPEHSVPDEVISKRRALRADKHATRAARAHKVPVAPPAEIATTPAQVEVAAPAPSQALSALRATRNETATTIERKPISSAQKPQPEPRGEAQSPDDLLEMQQVASAEQLLERSPARALALVRKGDQQFARGYFQQERAYIAIMALIQLDRLAEARARAASFAKQFPPLPYGARIRSALEARGARVE